MSFYSFHSVKNASRLGFKVEIVEILSRLVKSRGLQV